MGVVQRLRSEFSFIRGNYLVLVMSWILMDFGREIPETYYALYVKGLGGTATTIGIIAASSFVALAAVQFPGGYLADKFGRKWLISSMTFGVAFSYLFYALAPTWHLILVGSVFQSLCLIYQPALMAMISDSVPPQRRGMGFSIIFLINRVSTTPGPLIAGFFFVTWGLIDGVRIAYMILFVMFLAAAVMRLRLTETVVEAGKVTRSDILKAYPSALREGLAIWGKVRRSMFFLFLVNLLGSFSFAMVFPYFLLYAVEELGVLEVQWPFVLIVFSITMIVTALPVGKLVDKAGRKKPLLLAQFLFLPAVLLFVYGDLIRLFLAMSLFGLAVILSQSSITALQTDLVPQTLRGKVIGSSQFFSYILMAIGALIGGFLYESVSPQLPFLLLAMLIVPQAVLIAWLVHEPETRERSVMESEAAGRSGQ
ncbi:MAG: MFS transporter [Candidatus Geothermarchaeales archaeon]